MVDRGDAAVDSARGVAKDWDGGRRCRAHKDALGLGRRGAREQKRQTEGTGIAATLLGLRAAPVRASRGGMAVWLWLGQSLNTLF